MSSQSPFSTHVIELAEKKGEEDVEEIKIDGEEEQAEEKKDGNHPM